MINSWSIFDHHTVEMCILCTVRCTKDEKFNPDCYQHQVCDGLWLAQTLWQRSFTSLWWQHYGRKENVRITLFLFSNNHKKSIHKQNAGGVGTHFKSKRKLCANTVVVCDQKGLEYTQNLLYSRLLPWWFLCQPVSRWLGSVVCVVSYWTQSIGHNR